MASISAMKAIIKKTYNKNEAILSKALAEVCREHDKHSLRRLDLSTRLLRKSMMYALSSSARADIDFVERRDHCRGNGRPGVKEELAHAGRPGAVLPAAVCWVLTCVPGAHPECPSSERSPRGLLPYQGLFLQGADRPEAVALQLLLVRTSVGSWRQSKLITHCSIVMSVRRLLTAAANPPTIVCSKVRCEMYAMEAHVHTWGQQHEHEAFA